MERSARLHSIEALRGLAALGVTWFHLTNGYPSDDPVRASGSYGWLGVDCFFVISGFVIPYSLYVANYQITGFGRFLARRLVRLEPPYLVSVAVVILLQFASSYAPGFRGADPHYSVTQISAHLLYMIPLTSYDWIGVVYWSLAYEFAFYITAGLLFSVLWKRHLLLTAALSGAVFIAGFALTHTWNARLLLFLFGIAAVRFYVGRDPPWQFAVCIAANAGIIVLTGATLSALVGAITALMVVFVKIPAWRPLTALGAISYSLYLIHVPIGGRIVHLGERFIRGQVQELAISLVALVLSLMCAWVFYRAIEVASTRASKKIALKPAPSSALVRHQGY
jgi:peptidoglycan/LPS O-acetylase OafA/YrhL